jgi:hypothetical protein
MTTAIKSALSPFAQPETELNANAIPFLDEKLACVPASDIPEDFRKLSRFFPARMRSLNPLQFPVVPRRCTFIATRQTIC